MVQTFRYISMKKLTYREGDLFILPLRDRGYAVGLVAKSGPRGRVLFGYFFGPRYGEVPRLSELTNLSPEDAILRCRFGDLHLMDGAWPVLGQMPGWERATWTMPPFVRHDSLTGRKFQVIYCDADPNVVVTEMKLASDADIEPKDALAGAGAVEIKMTKLLSET
jgi:hypothetical protein